MIHIGRVRCLYVPPGFKRRQNTKEHKLTSDVYVTLKLLFKMLPSNFCSYMKNGGQKHVLFAFKNQVLKFLRYAIKILTPLSL